jgi:hypothetical protein
VKEKNQMRDHDQDAFEINDGKRVLRDGYRFRVSLADASMSRQQRDVARDAAGRSTRVTDANGDGGLALHRPGWRFTGDSLLADQRRAHVDSYEQDQLNAWQQKPPVGGNGPPDFGSDNDEDDDDDNLARQPDGKGWRWRERPKRYAGVQPPGRSAARSDGMTLDQIARDHQERMASEYARLDTELAGQWRRK